MNVSKSLCNAECQVFSKKKEGYKSSCGKN